MTTTIFMFGHKCSQCHEYKHKNFNSYLVRPNAFCPIYLRVTKYLLPSPKANRLLGEGMQNCEQQFCAKYLAYNSVICYRTLRHKSKYIGYMPNIGQMFGDSCIRLVAKKLGFALKISGSSFLNYMPSVKKTLGDPQIFLA